MIKDNRIPKRSPMKVHYWWDRRNQGPLVRRTTQGNEHLQRKMNELKGKCLSMENTTVLKTRIFFSFLFCFV